MLICCWIKCQVHDEYITMLLVFGQKTVRKIYVDEHGMIEFDKYYFLVS